MSEIAAVEVRNLSKNYPLSGSQFSRFRRLFAGNSRVKDGLWALHEVSFTVARGEAFGIIGANGSGKSTLLQIIAGILRPTSGSVHITGRLSALLELGSGFSPEFTGRDNVYLNGSLLGLSREEIDERFETIEKFAEIGDFIDQPVKTYSTGMVLRLAFAVTAHVDPEILIVDEALAVGDIAFRQRCMRRIHDLRARGTTILFVSHESSDVKALCDRCVWLENGVVRQSGAADSVVARYMAATLQREITSEVPPPEVDAAPVVEGTHRFGDGRATIIAASFKSTASVFLPGDRLTLSVSYRIESTIPTPIAGFLFRNSKGENVFGTNTARENYPVSPMHKGEAHMIDFHWTVPQITPGHYSISVGMADGNIEEFTMCDYVEDAVRLTVGTLPNAGCQGRGSFRLPCAEVVVYRN